MQQAIQQGRFKPLEKQILNTGLVIICKDIQEHKLTDEQQEEHIHYTWTETRYTQLEYLQVLEQENMQLWDTVEWMLKGDGSIPATEETA